MNRKILLLLVFVSTLNCFTQNFRSIWNTTNTESGSSPDNQIIIPTDSNFTYNYTINWGDGNSDTNVTGDITHTYTNPGTYTIEISGIFPTIYFNNSGDKLKIIEILSWGTIQWETMENSFFGCERMNFDAIDSPNLSRVTSLKNMFKGCTIFNGIVNDWNVSTVTDISGMFASARSFNRPLANWNVSNVTNMAETFSRTSFNEPLDGWNVAKVTDMSGMFNQATQFNQNIEGWNVGNVTNMTNMFLIAQTFNQPLDNWNVSNVTNMAGMFARARDFNQPINSWNVANVTDMSGMFSAASSRDFNQPLNKWNVGNVTNMKNMFENCRRFNQPIGNWNVENVTNMSAMFREAQDFNQPIGDWNVSSVTTMAEMFSGRFSRQMAFNQPIGKWNVGKVTDMKEMFKICVAFDQPIGDWNVEKVTSMEEMFFRAENFNQPLNNWTTNSLKNIESMFFRASAFNNPVSNWNVSGIKNMTNVFYQATAFNQSLENWNISIVESMNNMLSNTSLSKENYDNTLISWAAQSVMNDITFGAVDLRYCDGRDARQQLINTNNWTIVGDTVDCDFVLCTEIISPQNGDINVPANSDIRWNPAPNATGYIVSIRREDDAGNVLQIVKDNEDVGNVVGVTFTNEFIPGDNVFVTVTPYNASGSATGCEEIQFKTIASWVNSPEAFKITIDTRNLDRSSSNANQIILEVFRGLTYNYSVDWGDNQYNNGVSAEITHTYLNPGEYTIAIIGDYPAHVYNRTDRDNKKLISVDQWGTQVWQTMVQTFWFCDNMEYNATDVPNLSNVISMARMFRRNKAFNGNINNWDVSNVIDMRNMFYQAEIYNQPLNNWNVSNVVNMENMFNTAKAFNQPLNNWNVSKVTDMNDMFNDSEAFNQPINDWNVSNVTDMKRMFANASRFNQPLDKWNASNVTTMEEMFNNASSFNGTLNDWTLGKVTSFKGLFNGAVAFNQPLDKWDVSTVTDMRSTFQNARAFNQPLNDWNVSNAINMSSMFSRASTFNQPLDKWNVSSTLSMSRMFSSASDFNQDISKWEVTKVRFMDNMFAGATNFNQPLVSWDVNSVVNMSGMFFAATSFNQPLNDWDVSAVANMSSLFQQATAFNQPLNDWDVSSVTLMEAMFKNASLFNNPINDWEVASVTNMNSMFQEASAFNQMLDKWDTREVLTMESMFENATVFNESIDSWNVSFVTTMKSMFKNAKAYNQSMNSWNVASVTTMETMFSGASVFNTTLENWNVRNVKNMRFMFASAIAFDQPLNSWRTVNVENMDGLFFGATSFNQSLSQWNLGEVTMDSTFERASSFNQFLGDWDISQVTNMDDMLDRSALSRENYDKTLIEWSKQTLNPGIRLGAEGLPYCDAFEERQAIIDTYGWTINGDILDCPIPECARIITTLRGATNVPVNTNLIWDSVEFARGYRLIVTVSGTEIVNEIVNDTFYDFPTDFSGGETVVVTITPFNDVGDATGPCAEDSFTIASTSASVPNCTSLTLPLDNDTNVPVNTNLSWNTVINATGYKVTVGTSSGLTDVINEDVGNITTYNPLNNLPENTLLFISIIPYNSEGDAVGCIEESFTTQIIPKPPTCTTLSMPLNNAIDVPITTDVSWNPVANATGYLVTIGSVSGAINIANNVDVSNNTTYDIPEDLLNDRVYYVTITPYNSIGDATSCIEESFTTASPPPVIPNCTTLSNPTNGAVDIPTSLASISWNPIANADGYLITISGTASNNVTNFDVTTGNTYNFANAFTNDETVSVTITPYNSAGNASSCSTENFTIESPTIVIPNCTTLSNPTNGAIDIPTNLASISWNSVANADGYLITISGTASNNVTNFDVTTGNTYSFANTFTNDETVNVTITPYNSAGNASSCSTENFTIESPTIVIPNCTTLSNPANGAVDIPTSLASISWNPIANADGYRISIGTSPNGTDILDNEDTGMLSSYNLSPDLLEGTSYYVTIIPYNSAGNATNCSESIFTTITTPKNNVQFGFSPNGDGINDFWRIEGIENHPDNTVTIYNRWGDEVFQIQGYDNKLNIFEGVANKKTKMGANKLPNGTYFYQFTIDGTHNFKKLKGYVVIKR